ncbi:MAG: zinc-ribbon domain-containing protein [Candidatus Obscuribacterales bacterium]|nr:zinc-ribbon domain-containing protein [Candidatus Obscuribacterales bacterium]
MTKSNKDRNVSRKAVLTVDGIRQWYVYSAHPPLAVTHKRIAKEFHPSKNGDLTAEDFTFGSQETVWWKCTKDADHPAWKARIGDRTIKESGCPYCAGTKPYKENNLKKLFPGIAKEWHPTRNPTSWPSEVLPKSSKKVWWQCAKVKTHEWECVISSRTNGSGCPFCSGQKACNTNSLSSLYPSIAQQWHKSLNGKLRPENVTCGSRKLVWWKCQKGLDHIWQAPIKLRTQAVLTSTNGCPFCHGLKPSTTNQLIVLFPDIAAEWHKSENRKLGLEVENVVAKSTQKVWWICRKNRSHKWQTKVQDRTSKSSGCPYCKGKIASKANNLRIKYPDIAAEWHHKKNGELSPSDVLPMSSKRAWWQCKQNSKHEWQTVISARTFNGTGCPFCKGRKQRIN